ncbi:MAG: hypothetical protein FWG29_05485 [Treponema sp.]|nr:hypothetical protein [Treponema sp.]
MVTKPRDEIQKELYNLYSQVTTEEILNKVKEKNLKLPDNEKSTDPLFIRVSEDYLIADVKLMIFGQETNGWGSEEFNVANELDIIEMLICGDNTPDCMGYRGFFNKKYCYKYGGQFWNMVKRFIIDLQKENQNKKIDYIWNNVIKMGKKGIGFPNYWYNDIVKPYFNNLIIKEINILKPDFIIFFCGHNYDKYINDIFNNPQKISVAGFNEQELCEIKIQNIKRCFRTYHPQFLYRDNLNRPYSDYLQTIIGEIKNYERHQ